MTLATGAVEGGPYDLLGTTLADLERASLLLLDKTIEYYNPATVWSLFSGGTDSTTILLLAMKHPRVDGALHLDTETGVKQTRQHVETVVNAIKCDLVIEPPRTTNYEELVTRMGFPGRPQHNKAYAALKDRALNRLSAKKRNGNGRVLLISGARAEESRNRMGYGRLLTDPVEEAAKKGKKSYDNRLWLNLIYSWPKDATRDYAEQHGIGESPVSKRLGMSGECLCGAYAAPGERDRLKMHYPDREEWITWLEGKAEAAGQWAHWGMQAPKAFKAWDNMPSLDEDDVMLCTDCKRRSE